MPAIDKILFNFDSKKRRILFRKKTVVVKGPKIWISLHPSQTTTMHFSEVLGGTYWNLPKWKFGKLDQIQNRMLLQRRENQPKIYDFQPALYKE